MTLTQGHNYNLGFFTQGQVWFSTQGQFFIFIFNLDDDSGSILNFQLKVEFYSLNDDSGSRFIYVWLSVDDCRSRISIYLFLYDSRSRFILWLVTQDQKLILFERWFACLWGLNDWFWKLFLMCLWRFVHGKVFPWIFFLMLAFLEILIVKIFSRRFFFF